VYRGLGGANWTLEEHGTKHFLGKRYECNQLATVFYVHHRILSAVKRVEFLSDRMPYVVLRSRWCNIIVLNTHAPSKEKIDDSKQFIWGIGE
jgi:hypothetical protein